MKLLLSAFAFAPNVGSEPGVGWRWAMELARHHQVTVVTDVTRRELVEADGVRIPDNVKVVYYRPAWLRAMPLNSTTAQLLYTLWQFGLLGFARCLHHDRRFDLAIHLTYSVFRNPSLLGFLGIPFIFGPLGGGEDAPIALKKSIKGKEKFKELLRAAINKAALFDPILRLAYHRATLILVSTEQTRRALPSPFRRRALVYPNLGVDIEPSVDVVTRVPHEPLRILFAGRLLGWKGVHLAIRAIAIAFSKGSKLEFLLAGHGAYEHELRRLARSCGVDSQIRWLGHLPQSDLFALYRKAHCLLFPSLHDSGGTVVLEAQAHGLPVICLDLGGPATLVTADTAIVVSTEGKSESEVVAGLADALETLAKDESRRLAMGQAALAHVRENFSWGKRVRGALELLERCR